MYSDAIMVSFISLYVEKHKILWFARPAFCRHGSALGGVALA